MVRLRDDKLNLTRRGALPRAVPRVRLALPFLIFTAASLMLLSRLNHSALAEARWRIAEWMSPVLQAAMVPLAPFKHVAGQVASRVDLNEEVQRLKTENQKLSNWEWRARTLERRLADLEALSKAVEDKKLAFVTSRVIADASGAFVRSVVINAGRNHDIKPDFPVVNGDGLAGRIVETGKSSSRVMLPTDLNSRIPVEVGAKGVRAIMAGDNGPTPRIIFLPENASVAAGDDVATSGVGGVFPRGLRIGTVTGSGAGLRVKLRADLDKLEYLSVLFFENPALKLFGDQSSPQPAASAQGSPKAAANRERK